MTYDFQLTVLALFHPLYVALSGKKNATLSCDIQINYTKEQSS